MKGENKKVVHVLRPSPEKQVQLHPTQPLERFSVAWTVLIVLWCQNRVKPGIVAHTCSLSSQEAEVGLGEFKARLGYIVNSRPAQLM